MVRRNRGISIALRPDTAAAVILVAAGVLVAVGIIANLAIRAEPDGRVASVARQFLLDAEGNVPAYAAGLLLMAAAGLMAIRASGTWSTGDRRAGARWGLMALATAAASVDETVGIHEHSYEVAKLLLADPPERIWVVFGVVVLAIGLWVAGPLLRRERGDVRRLWLLALAAFGGGAIGVEVLSAPYQAPEVATLEHILLVGLEEGSELLGVTLLLTALLRSLASGNVVEVEFGDPSRRVRRTTPASHVPAAVEDDSDEDAAVA